MLNVASGWIHMLGLRRLNDLRIPADRRTLDNADAHSLRSDHACRQPSASHSGQSLTGSDGFSGALSHLILRVTNPTLWAGTGMDLNSGCDREQHTCWAGSWTRSCRHWCAGQSLGAPRSGSVPSVS
eukprot:1454296-Rhodomonas_salina.2